MDYIRKTLLLVLTFTLSISTFAAQTESDYYRLEISKMTKQNHRPLTSYTQARKYIMQRVHLAEDRNGYYVQDVYCQITFRSKVGPNRMPSHNEINIEHTWPQSRFNRSQSKAFQKSDLHHLYPTDSRANGKRGNVHFGQFKNGRRALDHCTASRVGRISETGKEGFEPPTKHKGNVARALFYFSIRYDIRISDYEEFMLRQWNLIDPVDEEEMLRNDFIERIQGNRNPFIDDPELSDLISDF